MTCNFGAGVNAGALENLQVLPVEGQNDGDVDSLLIEKDEFENWLLRHKHVESRGYNLFLSRMISCKDLMLCSMLLEIYQMNLEDTSMALPFWRLVYKAWEENELLSRIS